MDDDLTLDAAGIRCHVLVDGWRQVSPRFVFKDYDDGVHGPFVRERLDDDGKLPGRLSALLIEAPVGHVLVDTGFGAAGEAFGAGQVFQGLEALGVRPWDIRAVVITHGHPDHVGGLLGPRGEPAFPDARHIFHRVEADFWATEEAAALPDDAGAPAKRALEALLDAGLLDVIEADATIVDAVRAIEAPGHTPGHLAVVVNDAVLWAGDAFVAPLNVTHPDWVSAADMDGQINAATRRALLARAADAGLTLAAAHMPVAGTIQRDGEGFTWMA